MTDRPSLLGVQDATLDAFTLLVPAVGIATAWIAGGGHPTVGELAGSAVVLLGLGLTTGVIGWPHRSRLHVREAAEP